MNTVQLSGNDVLFNPHHNRNARSEKKRDKGTEHQEKRTLFTSLWKGGVS